MRPSLIQSYCPDEEARREFARRDLPRYTQPHTRRDTHSRAADEFGADARAIAAKLIATGECTPIEAQGRAEGIALSRRRAGAVFGMSLGAVERYRAAEGAW